MGNFISWRIFFGGGLWLVLSVSTEFSHGDGEAESSIRVASVDPCWAQDDGFFWGGLLRLLAAVYLDRRSLFSSIQNSSDYRSGIRPAYGDDYNRDANSGGNCEISRDCSRTYSEET